jgi:hypothetical protein
MSVGTLAMSVGTLAMSVGTSCLASQYATDTNHINPLKPGGYSIYHQVYHSTRHSVYTFVRVTIVAV